MSQEFNITAANGLKIHQSIDGKLFVEDPNSGARIGLHVGLGGIAIDTFNGGGTWNPTTVNGFPAMGVFKTITPDREKIKTVGFQMS